MKAKIKFDLTKQEIHNINKIKYNNFEINIYASSIKYATPKLSFQKCLSNNKTYCTTIYAPIQIKYKDKNILVSNFNQILKDEKKNKNFKIL